MSIERVVKEYVEVNKLTDKLSPSQLSAVHMGLFGEVGSLMAAVKKRYRERAVYLGYPTAIEEELGDILWYLTALGRRLGIDMAAILASGGDGLTASADEEGSKGKERAGIADRDTAVLRLGFATTDILRGGPSDSIRDLIVTFWNEYLQLLELFGVNLLDIMEGNLRKTSGRFLPPDFSTLPDFDAQFPKNERIPERFEIRFETGNDGRCHLQWKGRPVGDPLTDSIADSDGFRFHDVFHLSHAAILGWSPTLRSLMKRKRKSDPLVDEAQDGGRAIVIEEGLVAWVFSYAKEADFFEGRDSVSFGLLRTVSRFVVGFEVDACPLALWEHAILAGYKVFREVRTNEGGVVVGDRPTRTLKYVES